jgi:hypothetical protein
LSVCNRCVEYDFLKDVLLARWLKVFVRCTMRASFPLCFAIFLVYGTNDLF